jgi:hypothetical protein
MGKSWLQEELTLSDAAKLEHVAGTGKRQCKLLLQSAATNDFSSGWGELTEVDSGSNVEITGGVVEATGDGSWNNNGFHSTATVAMSTPGKFVIEVTPRADGDSVMVVGLNDAADLDPVSHQLNMRPTATFLGLRGSAEMSTELCDSSDGFAVGTTYTLTFEWDADGTQRAYVDGGEWSNVKLIERNGQYVLGLFPNIAFQANHCHAEADDWEWDNYERFSGFDTGGEDGSIVKDAGSGKTWDGSDLATQAASLGTPDGIDYTNVTFDWSYDDGSASWTTGRTLAQLTTDLGAIATNKRYLRIKGNLNSDGNTQITFQMPDMPDVQVHADFPDAANVLDDDTVDGNPGTFANVGAANVKSGIQWGAGGTEFTGTYSPDFPAVGNVTEDDTVDGAAGTYHEATAAEVRLGIQFGAGGTEFTGTYDPAGTAPSTPDVAVARASDTSATVTFSNSDTGVTNEVRYATVADGGDTWQDGGSRTGDGAVTVSGLTTGQVYFFVGFSADNGAYSEPSNVVIFAVGTASGATGAYAQFLNDLDAEIKASAALASKVSSGTPADHVKLGMHLWTDASKADTLIANGPLHYLVPAPYSASPRSMDKARLEFSATLHIHEKFDQSASNTLLTAINYVEALRQELMSEADGTGGTASWLTRGGNLEVRVTGPRKHESKQDRLVTEIEISCVWPEDV